MTKQEARAAARALWRQWDADALRRQGAAMAEALLAQGAWQQAGGGTASRRRFLFCSDAHRT